MSKKKTEEVIKTQDLGRISVKFESFEYEGHINMTFNLDGREFEHIEYDGYAYAVPTISLWQVAVAAADLKKPTPMNALVVLALDYQEAGVASYTVIVTDADEESSDSTAEESSTA